MICEKCQRETPEEDSHDHFGQMLCDDCYMDALSPTRSCDPWAVHSAKRLEASGGGVTVNETQQRIIQFLTDKGDAEPGEVIRELKIEENQFLREVAALRHAEKVRATLKDGRKVLRLW